MRLVGIAGKAGSGKDTVADHLVRNHWFRKYSFAQPLKAFFNDLCEWTPEELEAKGISKEDEVLFPEMDTHTIREQLAYHFESFVNVDVVLTKMMEVFSDYDELGVGTLVQWRMPQRKAWQLFGTEVMRALYPNVWVHLAEKMFNDNTESTFVIADVRFPNEVEFVRKNGYLIHLYREDAPESVGVANHQSEVGVAVLGDEDMIMNDYGLNELYSKVNDLVDKWDAV